MIKHLKKRSTILCLGLAVGLISGHGFALHAYEGSLPGWLVYRFEDYLAQNGGRLPDSWTDLSAVIPGSLEGTPLDEISNAYSLIPAADRAKFPMGELLAISHRPMPREGTLALLQEFISSHRVDALNEAEKKAFDAALAVEKARLQMPMRLIVYRGEDKIIRWERVPEEEVQAMLNKGGIAVPPLTPLFPHSQAGQAALELDDAVRNGLPFTPPDLSGVSIEGSSVSTTTSRAATANEAKSGASKSLGGANKIASLLAFVTPWKVAIAIVVLVLLFLGWQRRSRG